MTHLKQKIIIIYESFIYVLLIFWYIGVFKNGYIGLYTINRYYDLQVNALIHWRFDIYQSPLKLAHDLVWSNNGVHQVWGLGIPLIKLPFYLLSKIFGFEFFPDMIIFGFVLYCFSYISMKIVFLLYQYYQEQCLLMIFTAIITILLFPTFIGTMTTRYDIYEEAVIYEYIYAIIIGLLLIKYSLKNQKNYLYIIMTLSGLGGLIRPTLILYGISAVISLIIIIILMEKHLTTKFKINIISTSSLIKSILKNNYKHLSIGICLYLTSFSILLITNNIRFGNMLEFGHKLNLQTLYGSMYATRFDHPYQNENIISASKELLGLLFLIKNPESTDNYYAENLFSGQSKTLRWREIYMTTFNLLYIPFILTGLFFGIYYIYKIIQASHNDNTTEYLNINYAIISITLYAMITFILLFLFYLRNSVISTRYILDFSAAIAFLVMSSLISLNNLFIKKSQYIYYSINLLFIAFLVYNLHGYKSCFKEPIFLSYSDIKGYESEKKMKTTNLYFSIPEKYDLSTDTKKYNIPFNFNGWAIDNDSIHEVLKNGINFEQAKGMVKPIISLFIENPEYLELEVVSAIIGGEKIKPTNIRVKIGLEYLEIDYIKQTNNSWILRYKGPKNKLYKNGIQVAFIVFVPNTRLADKVAPWRLLRIQWRD
ncbi:MAG: hypothetical protein ACP5MG_03140 [Verrucomicrobiia bacterium]|jgi:hypothetical protein